MDVASSVSQAVAGGPVGGPDDPTSEQPDQPFKKPCGPIRIPRRVAATGLQRRPAADVAADGADSVTVAPPTAADPAPAATETAQAATEPTELAQAVTEPTQAVTEPTELTQAVTEPTELAQAITEPTQAVTEPTELTQAVTEPMEPTQAVTEPTQAVTESTQAVTKPAQTGTKPTHTVTEPAQTVTGPTEPAYRPPAWAGRPARPYSLEVLRAGQIVDTVQLTDRECVVFGRLADCDVPLQHPSVSRHHAALVYRAAGSSSHEAGFYLYDLGSTHGTLLNKAPVPARVYCRMRVGHLCKFGGSSRMFLLQGPEDDQEAESELTVTELKAIGERREQTRNLPKAEKPTQSAEAEQESPVSAPPAAASNDDAGISWGMREDADETSDLQFNPFSLGDAENEQLYLVDPKRTLRGWFEREGHELDYYTEDLPGGRFLCKIDLPMDTADGRPVPVEYQHIGKKKEAVFQCALEACRVLDRAGVLRQSKQEARTRRKAPAGYDSDEDDAFLDRTGAVERRRERRQAAAASGRTTEPAAETYHSLLLQYQRAQADALALDRRLAEGAATAVQPEQAQPDSTDELDAFMSRLNRGDALDRQERRKLKARLTQLRTDEARLCRLVNLARPASLPPLRPPPQAATARCPLTGIIGKSKSLLKRGASGGAGAPLPRLVRGPPRPQPGDGRAVRPATEVGDHRCAPAPAAEASQPAQLGNSAGPAQADVGKSADLTEASPAKSAESGPAQVDVGKSADLTEASPAKSAASGPAQVDVGKSADLTEASPAKRPRPDVTTKSAAAGGGVGSTPADALGTIPYQGGGGTPGDALGTIPDQSGDDSCPPDRCESMAAPPPPASPTPRRHTPAKLVKRKRNENAQRNAEKEADYSELVGDGTYDVWVPPAGQSGDGRTSLNDRFGY